MRIALTATCGLLATAIAPAFSQTAPPAVRSGSFSAVIGPNGTEHRMLGGLSIAEPMGRLPVGKPYSAERIFEHTQTLADGTHIKQVTQTIKLYRDSEGRTRTETILTLPNGATPKRVLVIIADPVAGYRYVLNEGAHTVRRMHWPPGHMVPPHPPVGSRWFTRNERAVTTPTAPPPAKTSARPHPTVTREPLGPREIDGLTAQGWRTTTTYPVGYVGNDQPFTATSEAWTSTELGMVVLSKTSDPRYGENMTKLTKISLEEPDPSLFHVPADYRILGQP